MNKACKAVLLLIVILSGVPLTSPAARVPVAVFPLQELGAARNILNLNMTEALIEGLAAVETRVVGLDSVIAFMAANRIRTLGHLDSVTITRVRRDLGAAFVLLGTVSQRRNESEPRLGLTLNLVRTSDARTLWTYAGALSSGEERRLLAIGEPQSTTDLRSLLMVDLQRRWPSQLINDEQLVGGLDFDAALLTPRQLRPGEEIYGRVRLEQTWAEGQTPRVFFRADEQLYPATASEDGRTYEARWVVSEENGRYPVSLVMEWPRYARTETALLGNYLVDGTPPLFELDLRGTRMLEGRPVFSGSLVIAPRKIVPKPTDHWRLSFYYGDEEDGLGDMEGQGDLPNSFSWSGMRGMADRGDGLYLIKLEAWDKAGNMAQATREVEMLRHLPELDLALAREDEQVVVDLAYEGKVPLSYWRLEMWTEEGELLTQSEGRELPVKLDIGLSEAARGQDIQGFLFYRNALGREVRREVSHSLPKLTDDVAAEDEKEGVSESWVDEF